MVGLRCSKGVLLADATQVARERWRKPMTRFIRAKDRGLPDGIPEDHSRNFPTSSEMMHALGPSGANLMCVSVGQSMSVGS